MNPCSQARHTEDARSASLAGRCLDVTTAAKSTIGSIDGNVSISAGNAYRQVGSDIITPKGDIDVTAKRIDIVEARETSRTVTETKTKQTGLTIAVTSPIIKSKSRNCRNPFLRRHWLAGTSRSARRYRATKT